MEKIKEIISIPLLRKILIGVFGFSFLYLYGFSRFSHYLNTFSCKYLRKLRPKRIILIRHGQSIANIDSKVYASVPDNKICLSEKGKEQADETGKKLKEIIGEEKTKFFVSPLCRTRQTFEKIKKYFVNYDFLEEPRLREQEWGNFQDPDRLDKIFEQRKIVGKFYYRFPDGESGADVYDRVTLFIATMFRDLEKIHKTKYENFVIVSHGLTMRLFLMKFFKMSVEEFDKLENPDNCGMFILEKSGSGKYVLQNNKLIKEK